MITDRMIILAITAPTSGSIKYHSKDKGWEYRGNFYKSYKAVCDLKEKNDMRLRLEAALETPP